MCASSAKPRPRASSSHAGIRIWRAAFRAIRRASAERERARRRRRECRDLRERREQRRRGGPNDACRRLVGHDDAAAGEEDGDDEREPERDGPDHPASPVRRPAASVHGCTARGTACAFASSAFGFPCSAAATTDWSPWLHALRADATEASAARCAASFRRSVSARAKSLASCCCCRVSSPTLDFVWRNAPRLEASVAASTLACLVRWFSALLRSAITTRSPPATSSAATARRRQSSARPLFVRTLFSQHPDDEHEHDRDGERRHADGPAPDLQRELLRPFDPRRLHTSLSARARAFLTRIRGTRVARNVGCPASRLDTRSPAERSAPRARPGDSSERPRAAVVAREGRQLDRLAVEHEPGADHSCSAQAHVLAEPCRRAAVR